MAGFEDLNVPSTESAGITELFNLARKRYNDGDTPQSVGRDGFPVFAEDPLAGIHSKLNEYLQQIRPSQFSFRTDAKTFDAGKELIALPNEAKIAVLRAIAVRVLFHERQERERPPGLWLRDQFALLSRIARRSNPGTQQPMDPDEFCSLASELFRTDLPFTEADLICFVGIVATQSADDYFQSISNEAVLRALERQSARGALSTALRQALEHWHKELQSRGRISSLARKLVTRIYGLLGYESDPGIRAGEAWSNAALEDLKQMTSAQCTRWLQLLHHCQTAEMSRPTKKWMKPVDQLIDDIGRDEFKHRILRWFDLVALPKPNYPEHRNPHAVDPAQLIADLNSIILKGMAWCCAGWKDADISRALSRLAQVCFKKVRNLGARCPRIANACVYSLSVTPTDAAAGELTRLDQVVKQRSAKKLVGKSLDKAAELSGQTREDLEESTVPHYGLDAGGCLKQALGDFTAEFRISGPDAGELLWRKSDGKLQKSVPAEVKEEHAADLKALKRTIQDLEKMLPAQRNRIERLLVSGREWEFEKWRQRYLDHPLLAHLSRRLIWHFRDDEHQAAGIWREGKLVDSDNHALDWLSPKTRVRLWHPLGQELAAVASWRRWLETHLVIQPFKQAHREIYILTDAEQQTGTYSNRFAAHVIRQHQFAALAKERGWTYRLQGAFDSHNVPTLLLPGWELAVEFWVDSPGGYEGTSDAGIYLHLFTDQVRFCESTGNPRPLSEVPALIFSEAMRDVDLFVGVCSIGNDPQWYDRVRGEGNQFAGYWQNYSFGDLSVAAKTRREVLEKLLPRLKITSQCTLEDKFLVVRGSLRTYKIHLGSANILMEPNDQYLCIVADRGRTASSLSEQVFLPFEGDNTLAVILSKAFLLAADSKIKDATITRQINAGTR